MSTIECFGLTRDYGNGKGLFDLDLQVPAGRVHGFLGPNGAGKTTAIRMFLDFLRPDRGSCKIFGLDPRQDAARIKQEVGYVPGDLALPTMLRGHEYLDQSAGLHGGVDLDWRNQLVERLGAQLHPKMHTLSKGNKQKIALIDALQHKPKLLILDEPTDGLDPLLRDRVGHMLREHAQAGGTVFLSSHIVHEIQTMCDDVSIVLSGRLRKQATIQHLVELEGLFVEVTVPDPLAAAKTLGAVGGTRMTHKGSRLRVHFQGNPLPGLAALHNLGATDPKLRQGDLEEMFLHLYAEDQA